VPLPRLQTLSEVVSFLENDIKDEAELIDVSVVIHALEAVEGLLRDIFDTQDRLTVVEQELVDKICDLLWINLDPWSIRQLYHNPARSIAYVQLAKRMHFQFLRGTYLSTFCGGNSKLQLRDIYRMLSPDPMW